MDSVSDWEVPAVDTSENVMTSSVPHVRWDLVASPGDEVRTSTPRDVDDTGTDVSQRPFPEFRPTSPISLSTSLTVKSTGSSIKRQMTVDSYMNMSGLSVLSTGSSIEDSSMEISTELIHSKRKILDRKMQNRLQRNAHFRDRYQELQAKRLALASIEEDEPTKGTNAIHSDTFHSRIVTSQWPMSPRRAFHDKKRFDIQQKNNLFRRKYLELQEKRLKLSTAWLDSTELVCDADDSSLVSRSRKSSIRLSASRKVSSTSTKMTSPFHRNRTSRRKYSIKKPGHVRVISQSTSALRTTDTPPPSIPLRCKRMNKSCNVSYDVIATIENRGSTTFDAASRVCGKFVQSELLNNQTNVTSQCNSSKAEVVTVRFSYSYQKDGKLFTEF